MRGRRLAILASLITIGASGAAAQLRIELPEERARNSVEAGLGIGFGLLGAGYKRVLAPLPVSVGAAAGYAGFAPQLEIFLPRLRFLPEWLGGEEADTYVSAAILIAWRRETNPDWFAGSFGQRVWLQEGAGLHVDVGFDYWRPLTRDASSDVAFADFPILLPHLRIGFAF